MKILRIAGAVVFALVLALGVFVAVRFAATAPEPPPPASESAQRLAPGPLRVGRADHTFVDPSRPMAANGGFEGAPARTLDGTLWYPDGDPGRHPLLVYSHGFMSTHEENVPLAELLASHGYVVVAVDFPLTSFHAPGGPRLVDVANQPGDISFVIDQVLAWDESERPFDGTIDPGRIGAIGLSLGGLTTELVSFHPRLRDPRIRAALAIAGPSAFFDAHFFANADIPFLAVAGTTDAVVDYAENALPIPRKVARGALLSVAGGSHAGFAGVSDGFPNRLFDNPDSLACFVISRNLEAREGDQPVRAARRPRGRHRDGWESNPPLPARRARRSARPGPPAHDRAPRRPRLLREPVRRRSGRALLPGHLPARDARPRFPRSPLRGRRGDGRAGWTGVGASLARWHSVRRRSATMTRPSLWPDGAAPTSAPAG